MIPGYQSVSGVKPELADQIRKLFKSAWPILDVVATTAPTADTLPPAHAQVYDDGTNRRIYFNLNGTIYYWGLTAA